MYNIRDFLDMCNFDISSMIIRSINWNDKIRKTIEYNRLKDELLFYKYLKKEFKPSIISALFPIILANKSIPISLDEAHKLFVFIRNKCTAEEYFGLYLLCNIINNPKFSKDDIISFHIDTDKNSMINIQKLKIECIIQFEKIIYVVYEIFKEDIDYINILSRNEKPFNLKPEYKNILSNYYEKGINNEIKTKQYISYNMTGFRYLYKQSINTVYNCSLFGNAKITKKIKNLDNYEIILKTSNTTYTLLYKIKE